MGIRQLQTFMQEYVPQGYIDVSLHEECEKFRRKINDTPIILIDLQGLLQPSIKDKRELLCGIRHNVVYENIDKLLIKLSKIAELIFFNDGVHSDAKIPEWIRRQHEYNEKLQFILELIDQEYNIEEMMEIIKDFPKTTSHLKIAKELAKKYGILKKSMVRDCDAEMAKFACDNPRVLGILAQDTDFLIYPGDWKYYSVRDLDQNTLVTKEYSRTALRDTLKLNDKQLVILSTLNGNDLIPFDDTKRFHHETLRIRDRFNPQTRFNAIARYIKNCQLQLSKNLPSKISYLIYRNISDTTNVQKIKDSLEFYNIEFEVEPIDFEELNQKFGIENSIQSKEIFKKVTKTHRYSLVYYDHTRTADCYKSLFNLFQKRIGIRLSGCSLESCKIVSKKSSRDPDFSIFEAKKIVPECEVPPVIELWDRPQYPEHDSARFNLLKWLVSEEKLKEVDLESIPKNVFIDILTLTFMVSEGLIDVIEADIILLSIKQVEDGQVPENLKAPNILNRRAFFVSFMFTKTHGSVSKSTKIAGLKNLIKILNFDGMLFHNLYWHQIKQTQDITDFLGNYKEYRYYG